MATYDPTEGVTVTTTKDELKERLRKAAATIRGLDRKRAHDLQEIEDRLVAKRENMTPLMQCVFNATEEEWEDALSFLEEFEVKALLPTALERLAIGGRTLLGKTGDYDPDPDA